MSESLQDGVDSQIVQLIVSKFKAQGLFDRVRRECLADMDTRVSYQNLAERVHDWVHTYLNREHWHAAALHDKIKLREDVRRRVCDARILTAGVERIVEQLMVSRIGGRLEQQVNEIVADTLDLDLEKWRNRSKVNNVMLPPQKPPSTKATPAAPALPPIMINAPLAPLNQPPMNIALPLFNQPPPPLGIPLPPINCPPPPLPVAPLAYGMPFPFNAFHSLMRTVVPMVFPPPPPPVETPPPPPPEEDPPPPPLPSSTVEEKVKSRPLAHVPLVCRPIAAVQPQPRCQSEVNATSSTDSTMISNRLSGHLALTEENVADATKKYHFLWEDVQLDMDDISDITVSSVHTSDLSDLENIDDEPVVAISNQDEEQSDERERRRSEIEARLREIAHEEQRIKQNRQSIGEQGDLSMSSLPDKDCTKSKAYRLKQNRRRRRSSRSPDDKDSSSNERRAAAAPIPREFAYDPADEPRGPGAYRYKDHSSYLRHHTDSKLVNGESATHFDRDNRSYYRKGVASDVTSHKKRRLSGSNVRSSSENGSNGGGGSSSERRTAFVSKRSRR